MAAAAGRDFLLKIGSTASTAATVAGLQETSFEIGGEMVDITDKDSAGYRTLLAGAGKSSISISAAGVLTATSGHSALRTAAKAKTLDGYTLAFDSGDTITGSFQLVKYSAQGNEGAEQKFSVTLESSGDFTITST